MDRGQAGKPTMVSVSRELLQEASDATGVPSAQVVDLALRRIIAESAMRELSAMHGVAKGLKPPPRRRTPSTEKVKEHTKGRARRGA